MDLSHWLRMILTARSKYFYISISQNANHLTILQVSDDMRDVAQHWLLHGFQYLSANGWVAIKSGEKNFLDELKNYLVLLFPDLDYIVE